MICISGALFKKSFSIRRSQRFYPIYIYIYLLSLLSYIPLLYLESTFIYGVCRRCHGCFFPERVGSPHTIQVTHQSTCAPRPCGSSIVDQVPMRKEICCSALSLLPLSVPAPGSMLFFSIKARMEHSEGRETSGIYSYVPNA